MIDFYTYLHCKPNGSPFYVGKGYGNRSHQFGRGRRSAHHQNIVAKYGKENIGVFVFPCESEEQAFADEKQQIVQLRKDGYELCNVTDGGDGISGFKHSEETRKKQSEAAKGRKHTAETIAKVKANNKAGTIEVRAKMSSAKLGKPGNNLGISISDETKKKISSATKIALSNPLVREKIKSARARQVISEENKKKLSEAAKADWAKRKSII